MKVRRDTGPGKVESMSSTSESNHDDVDAPPQLLPPAQSPILEVIVNDITTNALVDEGATMTLLADGFAKKHNFQLQEGAPIRLCFANGTTHITTEYCAIILKIRKLQQRFLVPVCPLPEYDLLLGADFIKFHNLQVDWDKKTITPRDGIRLSLQRQPNKPPLIQMVTVRRLEKLIRHDEVVSTFTMLIQEKKRKEDFIEGDAELTKETTEEFEDIFPDELPNELPPKRAVDHQITLIPGSKPTARRYYKMSASEMEELRRVIDELLEKGLIRPSNSSFAAPVLFVRKNDGTLRFCVDYRALNSITVRDTYPIPDMEELIDRLRGARFFSKLDLRSGYHQVRIAEEDVFKTAFTTRWGNYEWRVLPFGLTNAPATFQRIMNDAFRDLLDKCVIVYLDDILIFSKDWSTHKEHVNEVCNIIRRHKLYCKKSKCQFGTSSIEFVGHVVSHNKVMMDPGKLKAVSQWPSPKNVRQLRQFLGFANFYRKFIHGFAKVASPLTDCLKKKGLAFGWSDAQEAAFQDLKERLTSAPVLAIPDLKAPFVLHTDASGMCLGAVLSQEGHPVAYLSGKLNGAQRNYDVREQELLALITALQRWRHYLMDNDITAYTDHQSLKYIHSQAKLSRRLTRWIDLIAEFPGLKIVYMPGKQNVAADALSRINAITALQEDEKKTCYYDDDKYFKDIQPQHTSDKSLQLKLYPHLPSPTR